jgi:hypothetical protein
MNNFPTADDFIKEIKFLINDARTQGKEFIDILSKDLHIRLGGYILNIIECQPAAMLCIFSRSHLMK